MRILMLLVVGTLVVSCTSTQVISGLSCVPLDVPGTVRTMRVTYLYDFDGDGELEVWNHTYKYQQTDVSGVTKNFETTPLAVLPIGTELELKEVARTNKFDNSPDAIYVLGKLLHDNESKKFIYLWGVRNTIGYAPWESVAFNPRANNRFVGCEI